MVLHQGFSVCMCIARVSHSTWHPCFHGNLWGLTCESEHPAPTSDNRLLHGYHNPSLNSLVAHHRAIMWTLIVMTSFGFLLSLLGLKGHFKNTYFSSSCFGVCSRDFCLLSNMMGLNDALIVVPQRITFEKLNSNVSFQKSWTCYTK